MSVAIGRPPRVVVFAGLAMAFSLLGDQALYVLLPLYFEELGLVPIQVGILLSANRWIRLFTNTLAHRLMDRAPAGALLVASLALGALLTWSYAVTSSFTVLLVARCLWGLCWSFIRHITVLGVAASSPEGRVTQTMGFFNGISRVGSVVGIVGGGILFDLIGFQNTLLVFFALSLLAVPFAWSSGLGALLRNQRETSGREASARWAGSRALLMCGFCIGSVGPGLIMSTLGFVLVSRFGEEVNLGGVLLGIATLNGILLGTRWVLDTLAAPVYGAIVDAMGIGRSAPLLFATGCAALLAVYGVDGLLGTSVGIIVLFTCGTALHTAVTTVASQRGSQVYARYATAGDIGSAFGPVIGWASFEYVAMPEIAFLLAAALYLLGFCSARIAFPAVAQPH